MLSFQEEVKLLIYKRQAEFFNDMMKDILASNYETRAQVMGHLYGMNGKLAKEVEKLEDQLTTFWKPFN